MHASLKNDDAVDPRWQRLERQLSNASLPAGIALRLWDGFEINIGGEKRVCTLQVNTRAGLRAILFRSDSLKLGEAYIYGDYDVIGVALPPQTRQEWYGA